MQLAHPGLVLSWADIVKVGILLGLLGWVVVLVVVGMWLRYGVRAIFLAALINAILTSVLAVYANNLIQRPTLASLIGLVVGVLVGAALCWLCGKITIRLRKLSHG